jgi:O-antigen/teichoic acid export membrane protein
MVGGAWLGLTGVLWALVIAAAVNWAMTHVSLRARLRSAGIATCIRGCWQERDVLWTFSLPAVVAGVASAVAIWASGALLVNQRGGYADMGAYNAVMRIKQIPEMALSALLAPILPILSSAYGNNDTATFDKVMRFAYALSITLVLPLALILIAIPSLALAPYGPQFAGYSAIVRWLMLQSAIVGVCYPIGLIQASLGRMWVGAAYNASWGFVFITVGIWLVPLHLSAGLAAAHTLAYVLTAIPVTFYLYRCERRYLGNMPFWSRLLGISALSGLCWMIGAWFSAPIAVAAAGVSVIVTLSIAWTLLRRGSHGGAW